MCAGPEGIYTGVEGVCVQALRVYTLGWREYVCRP